MSDKSANPAEPPYPIRRVLGRVEGRTSGNTLIALGGIHGNEPSGLRAAMRVLTVLERDRTEVDGRFVCLAGNLTALHEGKRYVHVDLNRQWTPDKVAAVEASTAQNGVPAEHAQQRQILAELREVLASASGDLFFMDLHTSSAEGPPFLTVGDTLRNRHFASLFPLPLILGLEEQVDGALLELLNNHGLVTIGVEGGKHDSPRAVDCHEAMLWLALVATGLIRPEAVPDLAGKHELLRRASREIPRVVEVQRRHRIHDGDDFRMEPGFTNFQPIRAGQLLAHDRTGSIHSSRNGRILLPLYQGQGDDGFFIGRELRAPWLAVSTALRRLRVNGLVRFLPGVRRYPKRPEVLIVNTRIARWCPLEVLHLLGFRKVRQIGTKLVVSRRRYDLAPPSRIAF